MREWWVPEVGDVFIIPYSVAEDTVGGYDGEWISAFDARGRTSYKKQYCTPRLSIGQCIELLQRKVAYFNMTNMFVRIDNEQFGWGVMKPKTFDIRADELIDALWQVVKAVL